MWLRDGAEVGAVGRLALAGREAGISCMAVRPEARRRGHARAVLCALARAAADRGAELLWLQVAERNDAARALYRTAGFDTAWRYHYRTRAVA